jgi:23S rRNA pseudouridine1911/1915/1917 synthase
MSAAPTPALPHERRLWTVRPNEGGKRLDHYLVERGLPRSRTFLKKMIDEGAITLNGRRAKAGAKVRPGDRIEAMVPAPRPIDVRPEPIPLEILFEDSHLLVLNKAPGIVVHPAPGHSSGTLVNALLHHCHDLAGIGGRERPGIVHRLDKDTSGVMVVAKTDAAHRGLARQFKNHTIDRVYLALVLGALQRQTGRIDLAIGRDRVDRKRISPRTARPRQAVSLYQVVERLPGATLVTVRPQTGRTHQIRVHLASIGHPVLGDAAYGSRKGMQLGEQRVPRQMLHALRLGFIHPHSCEALTFEAAPPADMRMILQSLGSTAAAPGARLSAS